MKKRDRILKLLAVADRGLTGMEIHQIVGGFWLPYALLFDLEEAGTVRLEVIDGPRPRRHVYHLNHQQ
jgi:hypothetical protein